MNRIPNKFQLLKMIKEKISHTLEEKEKMQLEEKYEQIKSTIPKYRPHVLKKYDM